MSRATSAIRNRGKPRGPPLPHHRTNGSRIRLFGRLSQCAKQTAPARQPERHLQPRQHRFHPSHRACAPWTRRMQYRCSLASDFSSLSIPSRGTVRAFSDSRHLLRPLQTPADRSARLAPRPVGVGVLTIANNRQISRGKTRYLPCIDAEFTKCIPTAEGGLRGHVPARPGCTTPQIRFLFIVPQFRIGLPSDPASRRRPCPSPCLRLCENLAIGLSPTK